MQTTYENFRNTLLEFRLQADRLNAELQTKIAHYQNLTFVAILYILSKDVQTASSDLDVFSR